MSETYVIRTVEEQRVVIVQSTDSQRILIQQLAAPGVQGIQGLPGALGPQGPLGFSVTNIDGGRSDSVYGAVPSLDGGVP